MQMVIMTFRSSMENTVLEWLDAERLSFTFVEKAHGKGKTGHDLGSVYWGGINTMLFAGIQDDQLNGFRERMHNWQRQFTGDGGVHVFVLPCIQWF
jgi:hypothetical protein